MGVTNKHFPYTEDDGSVVWRHMPDLLTDQGHRTWNQSTEAWITWALFETTALALDSGSGSVLSSDALSAYAKHALVKTTA